MYFNEFNRYFTRWHGNYVNLETKKNTISLTHNSLFHSIGRRFYQNVSFTRPTDHRICEKCAYKNANSVTFITIVAGISELTLNEPSSQLPFERMKITLQFVFGLFQQIALNTK